MTVTKLEQIPHERDCQRYSHMSEYKITTTFPLFTAVMNAYRTAVGFPSHEECLNDDEGSSSMQYGGHRPDGRTDVIPLKTATLDMLMAAPALRTREAEVRHWCREHRCGFFSI